MMTELFCVCIDLAIVAVVIGLVVIAIDFFSWVSRKLRGLP
jgi:hypothetical protein